MLATSYMTNSPKKLVLFFLVSIWPVFEEEANIVIFPPPTPTAYGFAQGGS